MREKTLYGRVSRVENMLVKLLTRYGVSKQIFPSLPMGIRKEWQDMVVIDVGKGERYGSHIRYSVNVYLYGRPRGDLQEKNVRLIDEMEDKLLTAIEDGGASHYSLQVNWSDSGYDDTRNFHFNVVNVGVTVTE